MAALLAEKTALMRRLQTVDEELVASEPKKNVVKVRGGGYGQKAMRMKALKAQREREEALR